MSYNDNDLATTMYVTDLQNSLKSRSWSTEAWPTSVWKRKMHFW